MKQAEQGLRELEAKSGKLTPKQAAGKFTQQRVEIERGIAHAQQLGPENGGISAGEASRIKAQITRFFNQPLKDLEKYFPEFSKKLRQAIDQGIPKVPQQAIRGIIEKETPGESLSRQRKQAADQLRSVAPKYEREETAAARDEAIHLQELAADKEYIKATRLVALRRAELARAETREAREANQGQPLLPGGTRTQRLQALLQHNRTGEQIDPEANPRLLQLLGSKAVTTAGYAVSGALLYGGLQTIKQIVKETEDLQRVMASVRSQFEAIGEGSQFQGFRREILGISRELGVNAGEVATVGFQMKGAYRETTKAVEQTRQAIKAAIVTGLEQKELTDSLTGASITYGVSIDDITNKAIHLEEAFGVLSKESLKFLGDIAPVAREAGISLTEIGAIAGVVQQRSARGGAAIAEGLGRVFSAIQGKASEILGLYAQVPALAPALPKIEEDIAGGRTGQVLLELVKDYDKLDNATKKYLKTLLGGRREAPLLDPLFAGRKDILADIDRPDNADDGKADKRLKNLQKTIVQTLARMREELHQLGDALARAGLLDAFIVLFKGIETSLHFVGLFARLLAEINQLSGGTAGKLLGIAVAVGAIHVAMTGLRRLGAGKELLGEIVARAAGRTVAETGATTVAKTGFAGAFDVSKLRAGLRSGGAALLAFAGSLVRFTQLVLTQGAILAAGGLSKLSTGLAAVGGGSPLVGASAIGLIGASIIGTGVAYSRANNNVDAASDAFRKQIEGADKDKLEAELKRRQDFFTSLSDGFNQLLFGRNIPNDIKSELNRQRAPDLVATLGAPQEAAKRLGLNQGEALSKIFTKTDVAKATVRATGSIGGIGGGLKTVNDVIAGIQAGDKEAFKVADALIKAVGKDSAEGKRLEAAKHVAAQGKAEAAESIKAKRIRTNEDFVAAFASGDVDYNELIAGLQTELQALKKADDGTPEMHSKILALEAQLRAATSERLTSAASFVQGLQQLTNFGGNSPLAAQAEALRELLREGTQPRKITPLGARARQPVGFGFRTSTPTKTVPGVLENDPAALLQLLQETAQAEAQAFQESLANAPSPEAALARARGGQALSPETKAAYIKYQMDRWNKVLFDPDQFNATVDQFRAIEQQVLQRQILQLQASQGANLSPEASAGQAKQIAGLQLKAARAETDNPQKPADILQAQIAANQANQQAREVQQDIARARLELAKAQHPEDALALAQDQQREADQSAREAVGAAAQLRAQAQRIEADKAVRDAVFAIGKAQTDMLRAMSERAGDLVNVARLNLQDAQTELSRLIAEGGGPAEIQAAQNAVFRAQTDAGDAVLQEQLATIDHELRMKRISREQAIAQLQAAKVLADSVQEQRDLEERIQSLMEGADANIQFDLPANLKLPTLYEARRLNQSPTGGYQDNRNIEVNLLVSAENYDQAFSDVQVLVQGQPSRFAGTRLY